LTVQHSTACVATNSHTYLFLVLQISVYVNLSKNVLPKRAHQRSATPLERRLHLICGCKGTLFPRTGKTFRGFFQKKMHFCHPYIIYYICARRGTALKTYNDVCKQKGHFFENTLIE